MLTIFTTPKPFEGRFDTIQRNAIRSWKLLHPHCQVLLFGNESGAAEASRELEVEVIEQVQTNEYGTPLIGDLFAKAISLSRWPLIAYVNADIILMDDFMAAIREVAYHKPRFLIVGQRRNMEIGEYLKFNCGWQEKLRDLAMESADYSNGIDYVVFPKNLWATVPPFAIGRLYWDDWFVYAARLRKAPVVDVTQVVAALHQNHDCGVAEVSKSAEVRRNYELLGRPRDRFTRWEATHMLTEQGLRVRCRSCHPVCVCKLDEESCLPERF